MPITGKKKVAIFVFLLLPFFFSACTAVGPNYQPPQQEVPTQWQVATDGGRQLPGKNTGAWWSVFQDPLLDALVVEATMANNNLKKAKTRIREARAQRIIAAANGAVNSSGSATRSRKSDTTASSGGTANLFQIGFDARWELDLFGGLQRAAESADASLAASEEDLHDVLVSLQAEVASSYLDLRSNQKRLITTNSNISTQEKTVELVAGRLKMGLSNELDLMNAETQLSLTKAAQPALQKAIKQSAYQLAILLGQKPGYLVEKLTDKYLQVAIPREISVELPIDLLRQRPDIRAAERRLAAATADIGVATADLYPRFSLSGLLGLQSGDLSDLMQGKSTFWSLGPSFSLPLFDRGKIQANIEIRNARQEAALADYEQKVLNALVEVENSLATFNSEKETSRILENAVNTGQKAVDIANGLYQAGLSDFLNVLQGERALYQSQDQLAQSEQRLALSLVALFKALGGGWQAEDTVNIGTAPPTQTQQ